MKTLIILSLLVTLNACLMTDKILKSNDKTVVIKDKGQAEVAAIVGEQASFEWKESGDSFSKLEVMPKDEREKAVEELKTSDVNFNLYFGYDRIEISQEASQEIVKHVQFMQDNPTIRLRLEGHTDVRGTREYNLALGENRALSVKAVMSPYEGISKRIEVISYGEEKPQSKINDEIGWQKNRRVEFIYK